MKKKVFWISGSIIFLILITLIVTPFIFKGKILRIIREEVNKNLNAVVDFDENIHLNLFSDFPNLHIRIDRISIANKDSFAGDTLASIGKFSASLNIRDAIRGKIAVREINIDQAKIYLHVLNDTINYLANWDIMLPSEEPEDTTTDSSTFRLPVKKFTITRSDFVYNDELLDMVIDLKNLDMTGKGDFSMDVFDLFTNVNIEQTTLKYGGIAYISKAKGVIESKVNIDMINYKYSFEETDILLNDFRIKAGGYIAMPTDDIVIDLSFNSPQTDFKNLLSIVPAIYANDFESLKASGKMSFSGMVKGIYNDSLMPGFVLDLKVNNGMFRYPDLPEAVNNINLSVNIDNSDGVFDHTIIHLKQFHAELGKEPVDAVVLVKNPVSDPFIDASIRGKIILDNLKNFIKLDENQKVSGTVNLDLMLRGTNSYLEKQQYEKFQAKGKISMTNLSYFYEEMNKMLKIPVFELLFSPQQVQLSKLQLSIEQNDLSASGNLTNFIPYIFKKGVLKGNLNLNSSFMNLNTFLVKSKEDQKVTNSTPASATTQDKTEMTVFEVPGNIDFTMDARFARLIYDKMDMKNAVCKLILRDKKLTINPLQADVLNGRITVSGYYDTYIKEKPAFDFSLKLTELNINAAYQTFEILKKYVPIAAFAKGNISGELSINSLLKQNMMPDFGTLFSKGVLAIREISVQNFKPLTLTANVLEMNSLKNPSIRNIKPSYIIKDGKLTLNPLTFKIDKTNFLVSGWNGLDKSINYEIKVDVPVEELKKKSSAYLKNMGIANINMLVGETVPVFVYLTGSVDDPKIKTSVKKLTQTVTEAAKEKAKQEIDIQKQKAEEAARKEIEKQRQILEEKARQEQERLKQEAEQKRKEAEEKARLEAEKKKKELENEAKKKLKNILK